MTRHLCIAMGAVALIVIGGAAAGGFVLLRGGISARPEPSRIESAVARTVRGWAIPGSARDLANPVPRDENALAGGLAHFADHCAICHANDGSGETRFGRGLYPRPPDMRRAETQALTDGELFYIIENGVRFTGMPAWGEPGHAEASWQLVHFIRHLPRLLDEELARMELLNPRSPAEWRELQEDEAFLGGEDVAAPPRDHPSHAH
jgi:mono/diheme cytochrome c family protein